MREIVDNDFYYSGVDIEYDREHHCDESGCDSICRCSTIVNTKITSVDTNQIVDTIYNKYFKTSKEEKRDSKLNEILNNIDKTINLYTIDRIVRTNRLWDKDNFEVNISNGYYGEEVNSVNLEYSIAKKTEEDIESSIEIDDLSKRIEFLLQLEYGYILPELIGKNYKVDTIKKEDIVFGSDGHYRKIQRENLDHYNDINYQGIRGIVIPKDGKFKLIDGYHRCFKTDKNKVKVLIAY